MTRLLSMVLLLGVQVAAAATSDKLGSCPKPPGIGICIHMCNNDQNCPDDKKCCSNGCGYTCKTPASACSQPMKVGPCKASIKRYFYNTSSGQCESFRWGGCETNDNNYPSKTECTTVCGNVCSIPHATGTCKEEIERWYYDTARCKCKKFKYSGCGGNANNFLSKQDCQSSCGQTTACPLCAEPKKIGPCKAAIKRYYYDTKKNKCRKFNYGGCKPNGNNFVSLKACKKVCKDFVCSLPVKVGPCSAAKKRYYYDMAKGKCKSFQWGGCKSNGNNFGTLKTCKDNCM